MKSSVRVRPWQTGDFARLADLGGRLSAATLTARFWTGTPVLPEAYLHSIEARWPLDWDAVVAIHDGQLVGWAEYGRNEAGSADADAAFCVIDAEQGKGIGTSLMRALAYRAAAAGVTTLHADIATGNAAALHAWQHATDGLAATMTLGPDGYRGTIAIRAAIAPAA